MEHNAIFMYKWPPLFVDLSRLIIYFWASGDEIGHFTTHLCSNSLKASVILWSHDNNIILYLLLLLKG